MFYNRLYWQLHHSTDINFYDQNQAATAPAKHNLSQFLPSLNNQIIWCSLSLEYSFMILKGRSEGPE